EAAPPVGAPLEYGEAGDAPRNIGRGYRYRGLEPGWAEFRPDSRTFWVSSRDFRSQRFDSLRLWRVPDEGSLRWPLVREDASNPQIFLPEGQEIYAPASGAGDRAPFAGGRAPADVIRAPARLWDRYEKFQNYVGDVLMLHPGGEMMLQVRDQTA